MNKKKALREALESAKITVDDRVRAVGAVVDHGASTSSMACVFSASQRTVQLWIERCQRDGVDSLHNLLGRGRKLKCPIGMIEKNVRKLHGMNKLTPKKLCGWLGRRCGVDYSAGSAKRLLRELRFSCKASTTKLADAADKKSVKHWQKDVLRTLADAQKRNCRVVVQDEAMFVRLGKDGAKLWSPIGEKVTVERSGRRDKVVVYGAPADDGTGLMRTYDEFNAANFVKYLELARKK